MPFSAKLELPVLIILAGPAGSGKSTLCDRLVSASLGFSRVVTSTTRPAREGEINGVHYHFLSPTEFDTKIAEGAFLEWAWVHQKHRYGTLTSSVIDPLRAGKNLIINIDVQGVDSFHDAAATQPILERHMTTVYIDVPIEILKERLAGRGTDGEEEIARRLRTAEAEEREKHKFDYLIVSKSKDEDFQALKEIWKQAQVRLKEQR